MKIRTDIINDIIKDNGYKSYLEIGLGLGDNFKGIKCDFKIGIDPEWLIDFETDHTKTISTAKMSSNEYFLSNEVKFDLIFIDGLHHADQVERDIINSWNCLNKGGKILIHDVKPFNEKAQEVPQSQKTWNGDVWRCWLGLKNTYPKLSLDYIDERSGIAVISKSRHKIEAGFTDYETSYKEYNNSKGWNV